MGMSSYDGKGGGVKADPFEDGRLRIEDGSEAGLSAIGDPLSSALLDEPVTDPDALDEEWDGETWHERALESMTFADRGLVLAFALLMNLAEDLALLRGAGLWRHDPVEMLSKPLERVMLFGDYVYSHLSVRELGSERMQVLYAMVAAGTGGRMAVDRGLVVRLAKAVSDSTALRRAHQGLGRVRDPLKERHRHLRNTELRQRGRAAV